MLNARNHERDFDIIYLPWGGLVSLLIAPGKQVASIDKTTTMSQDNLSAVLYGTDDIRLEQRPIPQPKKGQLLIR